MQHIKTSDLAYHIAESMIADRFARDYGITTVAAYLDLLDRRTTAHLTDDMADRVIRTAGNQRRMARLKIEDGEVVISIPMKNPRTDATIWADLYLSTWLNVMECGADGAWFFAHKSAGRSDGQVRTKVPLLRDDKVTNTTITRVIANAKVGQQARILDRNPLNLRSENIYLVGNPTTGEGKAGTAKTHTRIKARDKAALRASLAQKRGKEC